MSPGYEPERIRGCLCSVRLDRMYRLVHRDYCHDPLGAVPTKSRFGDPAGRYAVLYAAETVRCGFWETLGRNRFARSKRRMLPYSEVAAMLVVSINSTEPLSLVDLRGDGAIRLSASPAVVHDSNHTAGRALSAATYADVPEASGFLFQSRFSEHACVAIFDRAFDKLSVLETMPLHSHEDFLRALIDYAITLKNG